MKKHFSIAYSCDKSAYQRVKERIHIKAILSLLFLVFATNIIAQTTEYATKDIKFKSKGIELAGTIFSAPNSKIGIVLVHGSGQELRLNAFATFLAKNGISVLAYDKRGVGKSGGEYAGPEVGTNNIDSANLDLLAEDAKEAVLTLKNYFGHQLTHTGLLGFSQAGWIIPLASNKSKEVDFTVIFSGAVVPTREQLRFQFFTEGKADFWTNHTEKEVRTHILNAPDKYKFITTDPQLALSKTTAPGLWLFGGQDVQVPVGLSIDHLNLLKIEGKPFEYCLFPEMGHFLTSSDSSAPIKIAINWIKNQSQKFKNRL
ncbi:alpha/beta hydrolase family protein [Sphingobacterium athyrii]|uniref:Alpha/beta hydrolase n=1 Tax=Sphingobacterium athyrii TaxID=2152717 RepID=A0A363P0F1_9SPHI|nr:alpha/beta hydrolase [Sphingobacterium athyrii]PUV26477.1 alpha/beta hydrolase [Sphingobacterium athyrii]